MKDQLTIRINDGYLDLLPGAEKEFFFTRQLHILSDLETRNGDTTKTIDVPRTPNNVQLLGYHLPSFKSVFAPQQGFIECHITLGGVPILTDALIFVTSEQRGLISIEIFGSQVLFYALLSEDSIKNLVFPTQEWTLAELALKTAANDGFLYGNSVWFDNNSGEKYLIEKQGLNDMAVGQREVEATGGWFYFKTVLEAILDPLRVLGLTFDTTFFDADPVFQQMVFQLPVTQLHDNYAALTPFYSNVKHSVDQGYPKNSEGRFLFDTVVKEDPPGIWNETTQEWTFSQTGLMQIKFQMIGRYASDIGSSTQTTYLLIRLDGVIIHRYDFPHSYVDYDFNQYIDFTHDIETIGAIMTAETIRGDSIQTIKLLYYNKSNFNIVKIGGSLGATVIVQDWFPDISQKEFIRELFKFFHVVPKEQYRKVSFLPWDKIVDEETQDITPYVDQSQAVNLIDYIPGYAQQNHFKYSESDQVLRRDTDHTSHMNKRLIEEQKTILQSVFLPCDTSTIDEFGRAGCPLFPFEYEHVDNNKINVAINNNTFITQERHDLEPGDHIFVWDDQALETMKRKVVAIIDDFSGVVDVNWTTGHDEFDWDFIRYKKNDISFQIGLVLFTSESQGNAKMWDGGLESDPAVFNNVVFTDPLSWPSLVRTYYNNWSASIYNVLSLDIWLTMPIATFVGLDFMRPVYLAGREAGRFYLNLMEQYRISGQVRANLIRLETAAEDFTGASFTAEPVNDVDLGSWQTGDPVLTQDYTLTNTGPQAITIGGNMTGTGSQYYSVGESITLEPLEVGTIAVTFNGAPVGGPMPATVTFSAQGAISQPRNLQVLVLALNYTVEPTGSVNLGTWYEGDGPLDQIYIARNTGTAPITLNWSLETTDPTAWELIGTNPITLQPNETANQTIRYNGNATDVGDVLANLRYVESTGFIPDKLRGLQVRVLGIEFAVEPVEDVDLGDWNNGDPPLDQVYNVSNVGGRTTTVTAAYSGTGFTLVGTNPMVIPARGSAQITFRFSGQPVADVYTGFVDFINGVQLDIRRNARANVPSRSGLTIEPVEPVFMEWDRITALPQTVYRWTNTGNTNHSSVNAQINNTSHILVGYGQSHTFDLAVGQFLDIPVGFNGATPSGSYLSDIRTYLFGGLFAQNAITTVVLARSYTVEPVANVNLGTWYEGDPPLEQIYLLRNTGQTAITLNWSLETTNPNAWQLVGTNPITLQPTETANQTIRYIGNATDIGDVLANLRYVESNGFLTDVLRGLQVRVLGIEFGVEPVGDVNMGNWNAGDPPLDQIYTINNIGGRTTTVTAVFSGTGFSLVGTNPNTIPPKQSAQITFRFSGQPLADVYNGFIDFKNDLQADIRRNASATVPSQPGLTVEPVADQSMTWDAIAARPTTVYRWTNTGNTNWSGINAQLTNTQHTFVGIGQSHDFDLALGEFLDLTVRYEGVGTIGTYSSVVETYISGGIYASRNIATTVQSSRLSVNPQGTQAIDYVTNTVTLSWEVHNTGTIAGTFDLSKLSGSVYWVYIGAAQVVVQPGTHYVAVMQFNAPTGDSNHGTNVVGVFQALNNAYGESQERNNTMRVPKLRLDPPNVPDMGTIGVSETVIHEMKNPGAAQITGTGYLEDDYGGSLLLVLDSYILNPSQQINRHVRYLGGNSGQKLVTVVYVDNASSEEARISFYVTTIG